MPANSYDLELRGLPKKERQALQREFARLQREEERRRQRRNRIIRRTSLITIGVALLAVAGLVIANTVRASLIGPANMASDGVLFTGDGTTVTPSTTAALQVGDTPAASSFAPSNGVLIVDLYVDYSSADAAQFETTNGSTVQGWVTQGYATLELHPVALASTDSNSQSMRTANAIACVANAVPSSVLAVHNALIADQATIAGAGLSTDELVALVTKAGVTDAGVSTCITSGEFDNWVVDATNRAKAALPNSDVSSLTTSPTVVVDGKVYTGSNSDATAFEAFVTSTYQAAVPQSTATPTPTPAPTP
ncbi:DsbA family protein [Subtercola boreus]|uniref:Thioredoxin-like fold domain-containing protein n=1 Tax=Subtercola boreus TaxID=120213 RepID=A0A3E0WBF2_9MICO|nr:thioredoxin domain-containing protein [Subtercola boreus]RFA21776.1 hypothetical protein B7R24_05690 [Subtercola boreus]RFA21888.1 hypothetical protein B7R23_05635 [Subtercola boreus]RFA27835.1 hypothetical protein B7R25_05760 [Subtercola boreus]